MQDEPIKSPSPDTGSSLPVNSAPAKPAAPKEPPVEAAQEKPGNEPAASPAWAKDLRKLYDAVVEEPLPDSFIALLSQLDSDD